MPQTPEQSAAMGQAGIALGLAISLEALAGVVSVVALHESAKLAGVIGAQLASGTVAGTVAGVSVGAVVASSVMVVALAGIIIAVVVLPTLVNALVQTHPHAVRSGGTGEGAEPNPGLLDTANNGSPVDGSITGTVSVGPNGEITVQIPEATSINPTITNALGLGGITPGDNPNAPPTGLGLGSGFTPVTTLDLGNPVADPPGAVAPPDTPGNTPDGLGGGLGDGLGDGGGGDAGVAGLSALFDPTFDAKPGLVFDLSPDPKTEFGPLDHKGLRFDPLQLNPAHGPEVAAVVGVPGPPLWILIGLGLGLWGLRRRGT